MNLFTKTSSHQTYFEHPKYSQKGASGRENFSSELEFTPDSDSLFARAQFIITHVFFNTSLAQTKTEQRKKGLLF